MSTLQHNPNGAPTDQPVATAGDPAGLRLPDFLIVGAPKCGTTTLYQHLLRHPGVFMSTPKEMSFFSKDEVYSRGLAWYAKLFEGARDDQLCGEASTTYSRWPTYPKTVDRLAETLPDAKLIYLVRNPIDRVYSFYAHRMREQVTQGVEEFLRETPEAVHSGLYMSQVDELLRRYPRERLHVLLLEDLIANPQDEVGRVLEHLGLDPVGSVPEKTIVANRGGGHFAATQSLSKAIDRFKSLPLVGHATKLLPATARRRAFRWLQEGPIGRRLKGRHVGGMPPLTPALRRELYGLFEEDLSRFERFLGRDLSHWKEPPSAKEASE